MRIPESKKNVSPPDWEKMERQIIDVKNKLNLTQPTKRELLYYKKDLLVIKKLKSEGYSFTDIAKIMTEIKNKNINKVSVKNAFFNRVRDS